jgi:hypothetical protein
MTYAAQMCHREGARLRRGMHFGLGSHYSVLLRSVQPQNNTAKFWLDPIRLRHSLGFRRNEINRIQKLVEEHREHLWRIY